MYTEPPKSTYLFFILFPPPQRGVRVLPLTTRHPNFFSPGKFFCFLENFRQVRQSTRGFFRRAGRGGGNSNQQTFSLPPTPGCVFRVNVRPKGCFFFVPNVRWAGCKTRGYPPTPPGTRAVVYLHQSALRVEMMRTMIAEISPLGKGVLGCEVNIQSATGRYMNRGPNVRGGQERSLARLLQMEWQERLRNRLLFRIPAEAVDGIESIRSARPKPVSWGTENTCGVRRPLSVGKHRATDV